MSAALDRAALESLDSGRMLESIVGMPGQLGDALWRVESAAIEPQDSPGGLIVAGMGGSAIGGTLARAALGDHASRPILCARGYGLPPWTTPDTTVLCASYSGETEETLACFESAGALGARRIVVTTGGRLAAAAREDGVPVIPIPAGFEPRAAVAYLLVAALEVAALCGAAPRLSAEIDVTAAHLEQLVAQWGPDAGEDAAPKQLARDLHGSVPVIAGADLTAAVAYRWKTQVNENAGLPAFAAELPELDHNEIAGWLGAGRYGPFSAVFLDDSDSHPRVRARIELTRRFIDEHAHCSHVVATVGQSPLERVCSLVLFGDLLSCYLAALDGTDPTPAPPLLEFKQLLAARE
ncbi:MAG TPA: bifunctional phosphoglucose/phosphomannose isomerase [Solirubrobacteraceae bacterium]|nr:bifunctional phosphoglucose/phosphomannose isomerase [Solirubrobacteraceae bacterium]